MSAYASQREALMAPGYEAMRRKDYATALEDFRRVLEEYPKDNRALMIAGALPGTPEDSKRRLNIFEDARNAPADTHGANGSVFFR